MSLPAFPLEKQDSNREKNYPHIEKKAECSFFSTLSYLCFFFFIAFGNLSRIRHFLPLEDSLPLSEAFLYFFSFFAYFFQKKRARELFFLVFFLLLLSFSYLYGVFLWGFSLLSLAYSLRLMGMVISGLVIGKQLYHTNEADIKKGLFALLIPFQVALILNFCIFFLFPYSQDFWLFLDKYSITFHGDPHVRRCISVYFDPNFYCVIAQIPFLLTLILWKKSFFSFFWTVLFFLSMILSWSRSGLAALGVLVFFLVLFRYREKRVFSFRIVLVIGFLVCLLFFLFTIPSFSEDGQLFMERFLGIFSDESAQARVDSWNRGFDFLFSRPFFGIGYNFIAHEYLEKSVAHGIDSSLLSFAVCFGLMVTVFLVFFGFLFWKREKELVKRKDIFLFHLFTIYSTYLIIVVLFASLFNNILFYPYWLVPMIVIFTYIHEARKEFS